MDDPRELSMKVPGSVPAPLDSFSESPSRSWTRDFGPLLGSMILFSITQFALLSHASADSGGVGGAEFTVSLIRFAGALVPTFLLARLGYRYMFAVPYLIWAIAPVFDNQPLLAHPLGLGWTPPLGTGANSAAWTIRPALGLAVESVLLLGPALLASRAPVKGQTPRHIPVDMLIAAHVMTAFGVWVALETARVASEPADPTPSLLLISSFFLLGALAGNRRSPTRLLVLVAPLALHADWIQVLLPVASYSRLLSPSFPFLWATAMGLSAYPIARSFERLERSSPRVLLSLVLVLNVVDVAFTVALMHLDNAAEFNPVVRVLGFPGKLVAVSLAAVVVARIRPRFLVWPVIVMLGLTVWEMSGLLLSLS
jgi:hypothetical protein